MAWVLGRRPAAERLLSPRAVVGKSRTTGPITSPVRVLPLPKTEGGRRRWRMRSPGRPRPVPRRRRDGWRGPRRSRQVSFAHPRQGHHGVLLAAARVWEPSPSSVPVLSHCAGMEGTPRWQLSGPTWGPGAVPTCSPGTPEGTPLNLGVLCLSSREKTARVGRALLLPGPPVAIPLDPGRPLPRRSLGPRAQQRPHPAGRKVRVSVPNTLPHQAPNWQITPLAVASLRRRRG